jgi:hypothetical protein
MKKTGEETKWRQCINENESEMKMAQSKCEISRWHLIAISSNNKMAMKNEIIIMAKAAKALASGESSESEMA